MIKSVVNVIVKNSVKSKVTVKTYVKLSIGTVCGNGYFSRNVEIRYIFFRYRNNICAVRPIGNTDVFRFPEIKYCSDNGRLFGGKSGKSYGVGRRNSDYVFISRSV